MTDQLQSNICEEHYDYRGGQGRRECVRIPGRYPVNTPASIFLKIIIEFILYNK